MSASPASAAGYVALTCAAELYEEALANGSLRGVAFEMALRQLRESGVRGLPLAALPPAQVIPVVVPPEVTAMVHELVRARGGQRWQPLYRDITTGRQGRRLYPAVGELRAEIGWVLHGLGYADKVIALALGVDRTTVVCARRSFRKRMAADELLAARVERLIGATRAEARAAA